MSKRRKDKEGTGIKLVDGVHVSGVTFQSMYYAAVNHYLIEVCDDKYKGIGQAIAEAKGRFLPDEGGAFIRLRYLGCNNEHKEPCITFARWMPSSAKPKSTMERSYMCDVGPR